MRPFALFRNNAALRETCRELYNITILAQRIEQIAKYQGEKQNKIYTTNLRASISSLQRYY